MGVTFGWPPVAGQRYQKVTKPSNQDITKDQKTVLEFSTKPGKEDQMTEVIISIVLGVLAAIVFGLNTWFKD